MSQKTNLADSISTTIARNHLDTSLVKFVLVPILILGASLLPPISLVERLLTIGYESIDSAGDTIRTSDGIQLIFLPIQVRNRLKVKIEAVSRNAFLEGTADSGLRTAAESLPSDLVLTGPVYHIQSRGQAPDPAVILKIPIPNGTESHKTLDLYTWNGQTWEWLPGRQIRPSDMIETALDSLPAAVAVMQTNSLKPRVAVEVTPRVNLPVEGIDALVEINPLGLMVEDNGQISGELGDISAVSQNGDLAVVPTVRNWAEGITGNPNPVDKLLIDTEARQRHVTAIVELVQRSGYQGIDLDYRGIDPGLRREFTTFLTELREALPAEKQLSVRVELPQRLSTGTWDTGAYDWTAIGRAADVVKLPTWPDPRAWSDGSLT